MSLTILPIVDRLAPRFGEFYADGKWRESSDGGTFVHRHPATNEVTGKIAVATADDVDRAVRAAQKAFNEGPWPRMKARERRRILQRIAELIEAHAENLRMLQTLDNGVPMSATSGFRISGEVAADVFAHHAGWVDKIKGEVFPQYTEHTNLQFLSVREPVGVVAGITPFNAPLLQFPEKVAPALAAGCCIIIKPSEYASFAALRMSELIIEADLPPGVFQILTGDAGTGDALIRHPGIDKIAFTGSRAVGEQIQRVAADGIKRISLELGGKSAAIIFPDCEDLAAASMEAMARLSMGLSGQVCSITSRALVHRSIYDKFIDFAGKQIEQVRQGNPFDEATTSGPLISKRQMDKVLGFVARGQEEGARLVFGGDRPGGEFEPGNWVNPGLFADVDNKMDIAREEIFGPVLSAIPFDTEEDAIRIANDSDYGLSAVLYTSDTSRAWRVGRSLRTGTVGVNGYSFMPNSPFGGFRASGVGREGGFSSIEAHTEIKTMIFKINPDA